MRNEMKGSERNLFMKYDERNMAGWHQHFNAACEA
jgi:hypothetical protein